MGSIHQVGADREQYMLDLDEIARAGARRMLAEALEAEVDAYIETARGERDEQGRALVVRNGHGFRLLECPEGRLPRDPGSSRLGP